MAARATRMCGWTDERTGSGGLLQPVTQESYNGGMKECGMGWQAGEPIVALRRHQRIGRDIDGHRIADITRGSRCVPRGSIPRWDPLRTAYSVCLKPSFSWPLALSTRRHFSAVLATFTHSRATSLQLLAFFYFFFFPPEGD
ncbi:hypothetical protein LY76DRAFT_276270 [Colletotrichum caudatum]|nr:hypothetical protein LY76DRAFT_276270 [Colletotrichum caudatum]